MDRLFDQVYPELKNIARGQLRKLRPGQTLNTTALVHETYFKFADQTQLELSDRGHFYAVAARAMRQVLVDHARRSSRKKRGDGVKPVQLNEDIAPTAEAIDFERVLQVDQALSKLERYSSRQAQIVHFRYFVGLKEEEIAELLSVTTRTVRNDWTRAKAWLLEAMRAPDLPPTV
jgi:RNA polymerase sigma factor (TIGR02999 family)